MNWAVITDSSIQKKRYETFSKFLNDNKIENKITFFEMKEDFLEEELNNLISDFSPIKIDNISGVDVLKFFNSQSSQVMVLGAADTIITDNKLSVLKSAQYHAAIDILKASENYFDINRPALIVGDGALARCALSALTQIGIGNVNITAPAENDVDSFLDYIERFNFDINVKYIPYNELIMHAADHSILVNTLVPTEENAHLYSELYYFNYLMDGGSVWDLILRDKKSKLTEIASELKFNTVSSFEFAARSDLLWLDWQQQHNLDLGQLVEQYKTHLNN